MNENWKPVKGFEEFYEVSSLGRVRSLCFLGYRRKAPKILKPCKDRGGYLMVNLCKNGKLITKKVHRLVAEAFLPNPLNLPQINHRNELKDDNRLENLEWCTAKYNANFGTRNERVAKAMKGKHVNRPDQSKRVLQFDLEGNLVRTWPSLMEVSRQTGWSCGGISMACLGEHKTAYHYIWRYAQ